MAIKRISELPSTDSSSLSDLIPVVNDGESKKCTKNNFLYGGISRTLTSADDGHYLDDQYDYYFVSLPSWPPYSVSLPDPSTMLNREIVFVVLDPVYESWFTLNGNIQGSGGGQVSSSSSGGGTTFNLSGHQSVRLLSNGSSWYITSYYAG
jgi:hypothetical protein